MSEFTGVPLFISASAVDTEDIHPQHRNLRRWHGTYRHISNSDMVEHAVAWMNGYYRFPSEFEEAAAKLIINNPPVTRTPVNLQACLNDEWNIVGLNVSEVTEETRRVMGSDLDPGMMIYVLSTLGEEQPPEGYSNVTEWVNMSPVPLNSDRSWELELATALGAPKDWPFENYQKLTQYDFETVKLMLTAGVTDFDLLIRTLKGELPAEYAASGS